MPIERDSVRAALARILASKPFAQSERMRRFLQFAVERALDGDRAALKEFTIGTEVFDRGQDYDPRIDSIVRVEARRLRRKLAQYYAAEGAAEPWRITLPEGSYVPEWEPPATAVPAPATEQPVEPLPPVHVVPEEAYGKLLEGRHFASQLTTAGLRRSVRCYNEAARIDPQFAAAYAGVAGSLLQLSLFGAASPAMVVQDATRAIYQAFRLNPNLPAAHLWRGLLKAVHDWNWDEAEVDFQRALELNPNFTPARVFYAATVMCPQARFDEARAHLGAAGLIDPASVHLEMARGMVEFFSGQLESAEGAFRSALKMNPRFYGAARLLAQVLATLDRWGEAEAVLQSVLPDSGGDARILATIGFIRGRSGDAEGARHVLKKLESAADTGYVAAFDRALVHLGLGEISTGGALLREAAAEHEPWLIMLHVDPLYANLRNEDDYAWLSDRLFGNLEV
ncbi:MAG: tetratricopeptide repeat protein [Acidobacteria bacterium]|nr:tetratricopeptide repeat protein [Acidobacteriota bacterium]